MNPNKPALSRPDQLTRAQMIQRTLGTRAAAAYMRRNQWTLEAALLTLAGGNAALERHFDRMTES